MVKRENSTSFSHIMHLNPTSTLSYWLTNAPFQQPTKEPLPDKADIVIIGGITCCCDGAVYHFCS